MLPCISAPRPEVSKYAPKMITMKIDPDKIREVIGKGGSVIQKITAELYVYLFRRHRGHRGRRHHPHRLPQRRGL